MPSSALTPRFAFRLRAFAPVAAILVLALLLPLGSVAAQASADFLAAIRAGEVAKVEHALKNGADVNASDSWGRTPLLVATQLRKTPVIKLLIERKADVNAANRNDITPLIAAAQSGNQEAVALLLAAGADPNLGDNLGWTPLMWAASRNRGAIVKLLLDSGADASKVTRDQFTAVDLARKGGADAGLIEQLVDCKPSAAACAVGTPEVAAAPKAAAKASARTLLPSVDPQRIARGNPKAPITIYEYTDLQCPYCAYGAKVVEEVMARYEGRVRLVVKHLPLPQLHPMAIPAARHFEAVALQDAGKAWAFYDKVFANQKALAGGEAWLRAVAAEVGADMNRLDADLKSGAPANRVAADLNESERFRFDGVPVFVVNGRVVEGAQPVEAFVELIE